MVCCVVWVEVSSEVVEEDAEVGLCVEVVMDVESSLVSGEVELELVELSCLKLVCIASECESLCGVACGGWCEVECEGGECEGGECGDVCGGPSCESSSESSSECS